MSKLADFLKGKTKTPIEKEIPQEEKKEIKLYNKVWLKKISDAYGYIVTSDERKVEGILGALNRKDGHCPCGGNGEQFLCPCVIMREKGICKCGLYENVRPVNPTGSSNARVK